MNTPTLFEITKSLVPLSSPAFVGIATVLVRYVVGTDDAYQCQRELKNQYDFDKSETSAQKFRLMLSDVSYIHLNIKFFCLNLIKHGMSKKTLARFQKEFNIDRNDVVLVQRLLKQRGLRKEIKSSPRVALIRKDQITKAAFDQVYRTFNDIYPDLYKHIRNRTYTKLRFISTSSNMEFYDLHMELMCKALQTYIKMVPTDKEPLHIANYIRSTVNNETINIIKKHTSLKRQRMVQGAADGFGGFKYEIPVVSENQLFASFGLEGVSYEVMEGAETRTEDERIKESNISFDMILRKFGKTKKRRTFIKLISMHEHKKFTEHLRQANLIEAGQDNVDYSDSAGQRAYFEAVCGFLNIHTSKAKKFMMHIARVAYPEKLTSENTNVR